MFILFPEFDIVEGNIYAFDLDGTLISTRTGKPHGGQGDIQYEDDWKWMEFTSNLPLMQVGDKVTSMQVGDKVTSMQVGDKVTSKDKLISLHGKANMVIFTNQRGLSKGKVTKK